MKVTRAYKVTFAKQPGASQPQDVENYLVQLPIASHMFNQRDSFLFVHLPTDRPTVTLQEVKDGLSSLGYTPTAVSEVK